MFQHSIKFIQNSPPHSCFIFPQGSMGVFVCLFFFSVNGYWDGSPLLCQPWPRLNPSAKLLCTKIRWMLWFVLSMYTSLSTLNLESELVHHGQYARQIIQEVMFRSKENGSVLMKVFYVYMKLFCTITEPLPYVNFRVKRIIFSIFVVCNIY